MDKRSSSSWLLSETARPKIQIPVSPGRAIRPPLVPPAGKRSRGLIQSSPFGERTGKWFALGDEVSDRYGDVTGGDIETWRDSDSARPRMLVAVGAAIGAMVIMALVAALT